MKYYGKEKCRILKEIRARIAAANDIEWVVSECRHQGNCKGTCPLCEAELRQLEEALAHREALGKKVAVVGISAAISLAVTGCDDFQTTDGVDPLMGDVALVDTTDRGEGGDTAVAVDGEYLVPDSETVPVKGEVVPVPGEDAEPATDEDVLMCVPVAEEE